MNATILSLCDQTGVWSRPYREAGYEVIQVDLAQGRDVRLLRPLGVPIRGILMAPPCTHLARSGAPHWARKGEGALLEGLAIVDACLRAVIVHRPDWWVLENPVGRLMDYLGPPVWKFDPHQFGDPWTKRTWLWGNFIPPAPLFSAQACKSVRPIIRPGGRDLTTALGGKAGIRRSITPSGFAQAFFESNP